MSNGELNLLDSKPGDILYFHYTPDNSQSGYRLVRVSDRGSYYVRAQDLQKNEPRTFTTYNASNVEILGHKEDQVKSRVNTLGELGFRLDLPGEKLSSILPLYQDDISSAKYHEPTDNLIVSYKKKPEKVEERLEVEVNQEGYILTFTNSEKENVYLHYNAKSNTFSLTCASDGHDISNPSVRDLLRELNDLYSV
jgi:hypothetical protein